MSEQPGELVTILRSSDPSLLAIAESMLAGEGIPYFAKGERLQNMIVPDSLGGNFNPAIGAVQLQVSPDDVDDARAVLQDLLRDQERS